MKIGKFLFECDFSGKKVLFADPDTKKQTAVFNLRSHDIIIIPTKMKRSTAQKWRNIYNLFRVMAPNDHFIFQPESIRHIMAECPKETVSFAEKIMKQLDPSVVEKFHVGNCSLADLGISAEVLEREYVLGYHRLNKRHFVQVSREKSKTTLPGTPQAEQQESDESESESDAQPPENDEENSSSSATIEQTQVTTVGTSNIIEIIFPFGPYGNKKMAFQVHISTCNMPLWWRCVNYHGAECAPT